MIHSSVSEYGDDLSRQGQRFIVKFNDSASYRKFQGNTRGGHKFNSADTFPRINAEVMYFGSKDDAMAWADNREDVSYVEEDIEFQAFEESIPYGIDLVNAMNVPDYVVGSGIKVCIIDTGYDLGHTDLPTNDIDGNGPCSDNPCNWYKDPHGHGTHVAGTIAAIGGNDQGVVGVIRNGSVPLHIVRALNQYGSGSTSSILTAMQQCDEAGANVVNMSLGTGVFPRAVKDAFDEIVANNDRILFVAAAGNSGSNMHFWPASFDSPQMMSVAALDANSVRTSFSTFNNQVDIAAPGLGVLSTMPGNTYRSMSGTSMASPHVAGVAALIWSHFPYMSVARIREALEVTAIDLGKEGRDNYHGHGLVDTQAALLYLGHSKSPSMSPAPTRTYSDSPSSYPTISDSPTQNPSASPSSVPSTSFEPTNAPRYCNYGFHGGSRHECDGLVEGGDWCNYSKHRCEGECEGQWCIGPIKETPTSAPSTRSPTPIPSLNPTALATEEPSSSPSSSPTIKLTAAPSVCLDEPDIEFFYKMKDNEPIYKTCEWLKGKNDQKRLNICKTKTESYGGRSPANIVCKCTCDLNSPAPSSPETSAPSATITESPSRMPSSIPTTTAPTREVCCSQDFKTCATHLSDWCHMDESNCRTCDGSFISDAPRQCVARWKSCSSNRGGCCSPATCARVEANYWQCQ